MENQYSDRTNQPTTPFRPTFKAGPAPKDNVRVSRARPASGRRWPLWLALGLIGLTFLSVGGFFGYNALLDSQYAGKIEPGVSISGVYVGELKREEARALLLKHLEPYTQKPVALSFQDKVWSPSLDQVGVTINLDASLDKALAIGHTGDFLKDLRIFKMLSPQTDNLPIEIMMDDTRLRTYLNDVSSLIRKETVEPEVSLDKEGKLVVTEGKEGFNVDYDATFAALKQNLQSLLANDQNILQVNNVPPVITKQEIEEFKTSLAPLLSGPVILTYKDKSWTFDQKQIAEQIKIVRNTDKQQARHLSYSLDKAYFEKFVEGLAKQVNQDPREAQVGWVNGKIGFTRASQNGQYLSVGRTMDNLNQALVATDPAKRKTSLWVDVKEPVLSSDKPEKLGNFELIGEGVSAFGGSATERATNIKVGAGYLNGAIIPPHSTFSFLNAIGEISPKRGYVEGYAIVADQTVPDVGGGICQVSTTVFRAAFYAGLPIVERNAHAYRVSWYEEMGEPVGFDAAVYQPGVDFKFQNPTDYYMAITATVNNGKLYVRILGNKTPGQTVEMVAGGISNVTNPPPDRIEVDPKLAPGQRKQLDYARKGLSTTITRIIKMNGKEIDRDVFPTKFQAWPNIIKVGPSPSAPKPAETQAPAKPTTPPAKPAETQAPAPKTTTPAPKPTTPAPAPTPTKKP